ncbi:MAG TPA: hypothetical protein VJU87_10500 [Gemmatimonadaceae bacterium]|nr:hypothetical protein [Gemmatimonadaceae bacterium]
MLTDRLLLVLSLAGCSVLADACSDAPAPVRTPMAATASSGPAASAMRDSLVAARAELARVRERQSLVPALQQRLDSLQDQLRRSRHGTAVLRARAAALRARAHDCEEARLALQQASRERPLADTADGGAPDSPQTVVQAGRPVAVEEAPDVAALKQRVAALEDALARAMAQQGAAYYVTGTKRELLREGVLMKAGRGVRPAMDLDPARFTRIDMMRDSVITLPEGEYEIVSSHDPGFAQVFEAYDGKISHGLRVMLPERFWASSRFLILMKS